MSIRMTREYIKKISIISCTDSRPLRRWLFAVYLLQCSFNNSVKHKLSDKNGVKLNFVPFKTSRSILSDRLVPYMFTFLTFEIKVVPKFGLLW